MAATSTITLGNTIEWSKKFNFGRRLGNGDALEPALTSANLIKSTMLSPPFAWRWNRTVNTFTCVNGQQDYPEAISSFGWIENASVQTLNTDNPASYWKQLEVKNDLALDSAPGRPRNISAQADDLNGNITFRLIPVPNEIFPISIQIQQATSLFTSLNQTWSPIPDYYSFVYSWGFLALMWLFNDDPRFTMGNQKFVSGLLSTAQGLTATERNIFLNNWQSLTGAPIQQMDKLQQGVQQRQV